MSAQENATKKTTALKISVGNETLASVEFASHAATLAAAGEALRAIGATIAETSQAGRQPPAIAGQPPLSPASVTPTSARARTGVRPTPPRKSRRAW